MFKYKKNDFEIKKKFSEIKSDKTNVCFSAPLDH